MKKIALICLLFIPFIGTSQTLISDYKVVVWNDTIRYTSWDTTRIEVDRIQKQICFTDKNGEYAVPFTREVPGPIRAFDCKDVFIFLVRNGASVYKKDNVCGTGVIFVGMQDN